MAGCCGVEMQDKSRVSSVPFYRRPLLAKTTGGTLRPGGFALTDRAALLAGLKPEDRVLDLGCGTGATVRHLRARYAVRAFGLDMCTDLVEKKRMILPFVRAAMDYLPFEGRCFAAVFCECVLSLAAGRLAVIREAGRVLQPGGMLIISDFVTDNFADNVIEKTDEDSGESCPEKALESGCLKQEFKASGFELELEEDHTRLAVRLAAELTFRGEDLADQGCFCQKPAYKLIIARKAR